MSETPSPSIPPPPPMPALSETTAIRLYNSVVATEQGHSSSAGTSVVPATVKPTESVESANEFGNSCRICRWNRSDMEILRCPCLCKGSVGYIHLHCLRRWILHKGGNSCEICNTRFDVPDEKFNLRRMIRSFMTARCFGTIVKNILFSASLIPLAHVVLEQVLLCMDNINLSPNQQLTVSEVVLASCALLTSSALFFQYFEYVATRFMIIRNILRQWWMFGSTSDFAIVEIEGDTFELL